MPGIEVTANNPLGITVAGPGYGSPYASPSYGGTGTITSGAGYTFDTFPNQQEGIAAGIQYITNKIQSGAVTTAGQLVNLFSPNDQTAFDQTTGLTPTSVLSASSAGIYAAGIAAGEGTLQEFGGTSAFTGSNLNTGSASVNVGIPGATVTLPSAGGGAVASNSGTGIGSIIADIADYPAALITGLFGGNTTPTAAQGANGPATATGAATGAGVNAASGNAFSGFAQFLTQIGPSVVWVLLGVVLILGAIILFAHDNGAIDAGPVAEALT